MRKFLGMLAVIMISLVACGEQEEELHFLEVDFDVPEQVAVNETVELKATVTYGEELVTDADEVVFEVWEKNDRENAQFYDAVNNEDGTYTYELSFDRDGIFEMYAHTTARDQHTMPLREVTVGEGGEYEDVDDLGFQTEGFDLHFMEIEEEDAKVGNEIDLITHVMLDGEPLQDASVSYEVWHEDDEENQEWIDATEELDEYVATYTFEETGIYYIQIHVETDDLHEHAMYTVAIEE